MLVRMAAAALVVGALGTANFEELGASPLASSAKPQTGGSGDSASGAIILSGAVPETQTIDGVTVELFRWLPWEDAAGDVDIKIPLMHTADNNASPPLQATAGNVFHRGEKRLAAGVAAALALAAQPGQLSLKLTLSELHHGVF